MTTLRCQSPSTYGGSSRHTPTTWVSTGTGSPRRSGSGRNEGEGRDAVPSGITECVVRKAKAFLTTRHQLLSISAGQHLGFVGSGLGSFASGTSRAASFATKPDYVKEARWQVLADMLKC